MTKHVPHFHGGSASLIDERKLLELQQREALLEASIRRQEELERAAVSSYDVDDLRSI